MDCPFTARMSINSVGIMVFPIDMPGCDPGHADAEELAAAHGVSAQTIWRWYRQGRIVGIRYNDRGSSLSFLLKESQPLSTDSK